MIRAGMKYAREILHRLKSLPKGPPPDKMDGNWESFESYCYQIDLNRPERFSNTARERLFLLFLAWWPQRQDRSPFQLWPFTEPFQRSRFSLHSLGLEGKILFYEPGTKTLRSIGPQRWDAMINNWAGKGWRLTMENEKKDRTFWRINVPWLG